MHPDKAKALDKLAAVTHELDSEVAKLKDVARNPARSGWGNSVKAATTLPFLGGAAVVVDVLTIGVSRISDKRWAD